MKAFSRILLSGFTLAGVLCSSLVNAQAWPQKPIKFIVPFSAGGANDLMARAAAEGASKVLGQTIVVENKPGAGGTLGTVFVSKSAPDGYTFFTSSEKDAKYYGGVVMKVFLDIKYPEIRKVEKGDSLVKEFDDNGLAYEGDAIVTNGVDMIVGTDAPNQIKLADGSNTTFDSKSNDIRYQIKTPDGTTQTVKPINADVVNGFYSPLEKTINETKFEKLPAKQWIDKFGNGEEANWTGLKKWLSQQEGSVSKTEIQKFLKDNRIQIVEVVKGDLPTEDEIAQKLFGKDWIDLSAKEKIEARTYLGDGNIPKFSQYQAEGDKTNYREWLVIDPKYDYKDTHWDEKGILAWGRGSIRIDADGNKVFHISEFQSGAGQKGKKEGFKGKVDKKYETYKIAKAIYDIKRSSVDKETKQQVLSKLKEDAQNKGVSESEIVAISNEYGDFTRPMITSSIAEAPFVTDTNAWVKLLWKTALKKAIEEDAHAITWESGETQFDRWGSEEIHWNKEKAVDGDKYFINKNENHPEPYEVVSREGKILARFKTAKEAQDAKGEVGFRISIKEQTDNAQAFQGNEEALRQNRLSEADKVIYNKQQLREAIKRNLSRDKNDAEIDKLTDRIWDRMQKEDSGTSLPRKEGMMGFYGSPEQGTHGIVGNVAKALVKELTGKSGEIGEAKIVTDSGYDAERKNVDWKNVKVNVVKVRSGAREGLYFVELDGGGLFTVLKDHYFEKPNEAKDFGENHLKEIQSQSKYLTTQHSIEITPELKASVERGQPLFMKSPEGKILGFTHDGNVYLNGQQIGRAHV